MVPRLNSLQIGQETAKTVDLGVELGNWAVIGMGVDHRDMVHRARPRTGRRREVSVGMEKGWWRRPKAGCAGRASAYREVHAGLRRDRTADVDRYRLGRRESEDGLNGVPRLVHVRRAVAEI